MERARDVRFTLGADIRGGRATVERLSKNGPRHGTIEMDGKHPADETTTNPHMSC
jgi:hypothetical protein